MHPCRLSLQQNNALPSLEHRLWSLSRTSGCSAFSQTGCYCGWSQGTPRAAGRRRSAGLLPWVLPFLRAALRGWSSAARTGRKHACRKVKHERAHMLVLSQSVYNSQLLSKNEAGNWPFQLPPVQWRPAGDWSWDLKRCLVEMEHQDSAEGAKSYLYIYYKHVCKLICKSAR